MMSIARAGRIRIAVALCLSLLLASCSSGGSDGARTTTSTKGGGTTVSAAPETEDALVGSVKFSDLPAFADVPWADELKAEQDEFGAAAKPESIYGRYTIPPFSGKYTNVDNSERKTLEEPCATCPKRTVWLIGSSAAFGLGQRDDYTTASYLVREGADAGYDLRVRNLAVPGTTVADEVDGLKAHLENDGEKPDLVVFMHGFNDVLATFMYAGVRDGELLDPIRFDDPWVEEFLEIEPAPELTEEQVPVVAAHIADEYRASNQQMVAMLDEAGIPHATFFQPDGFTSPVQAQGLALALNRVQEKVLPTDLLAQSSLAQLLDQTVADLSDTDTISLRAPAAELDEPVFADTTHFNETGAEYFAGVMYGHIAPLLG